MTIFLERCRPMAALLIVFWGVVLIAGCAYVEPHPPRHPGPYDDPVDALNATQAPADPSRSGVGPEDDDLGNNLRRLHQARETYNKDQAQQAARLRREQAACRANPDARKVRIQDGTDDPKAVYCQEN